MEFHEVANIFPLLVGTEYIALREDIKSNGLLEPIILYEGKVLDGRNRYTACLDIGIEPRYEEYMGKQLPLDYVVSKNLHRRHLNETQRGIVASKIANMKSGTRTDLEPSANLHQVSLQEASDMLNVSRRTVANVKAIERNAPDLLPKMESGEMTASKATQEMRKREVIARLESIESKQAKEIKGVYDAIVIDPPWDMQKIERDERSNQVEFEYPTMTEEELIELNIPMADDCHVWLWTTQKYLPMAFRLLEKWGLKYICTFVWHKPGGFQPFDLPQYNCEFSLYARNGTPKFIDQKQFFTCFEAPRGKHSEKPKLFYETIRRVTCGRRLDMFNRKPIEGFDGWGKESE
jgi:N6-adenosine-specific RNA methylase IME4